MRRLARKDQVQRRRWHGMDAGLLIAGLPVALALSAIGVWLLSRGATGLGMIVVGLGVLVAMLVFGGGMPRPDVVPRPGEEHDY